MPSNTAFAGISNNRNPAGTGNVTIPREGARSRPAKGETRANGGEAERSTREVRGGGESEQWQGRKSIFAENWRSSLAGTRAPAQPDQALWKPFRSPHETLSELSLIHI